MNRLVVIILLMALPSASARTWSTITGGELQAEFVRNDNGLVILKRPDGGLYEIPLGILSQKDQEYVQSQSGGQPEKPLSPGGAEADPAPGNAGSEPEGDLFEQRTWTSVSGATIQAVYDRKTGESVVLKSAQGKEFKIPIAKLIPGDRQFIASHLRKPAGQTVQSPAVAPARGSAGGSQPVGEVEEEMLFSFEPPQAFSSEDFPEVSFRTPDEVNYLGFQYGTGSDEVFYLAFDAKNSESIHDRAYLHQPKSPGGTPTPIKGTRYKIEKDISAIRFRIPEIKGHLGEAPVSYTPMLLYGWKNDGDLFGLTQVKVLKDGREQVFTVGGFLNEHVTVVSGGIHPFPLLKHKPELELKAVYNYGKARLVGNLNLGESNRFLPERGMQDVVNVIVKQDDDQVIERIRLDVGDEKDLRNSAYSGQFNYEMKRVKPGQTYKVEAQIDLGPVMGVLESSFATTVPKDLKKKR